MFIHSNLSSVKFITAIATVSIIYFIAAMCQTEMIYIFHTKNHNLSVNNPNLLQNKTVNSDHTSFPNQITPLGWVATSIFPREMALKMLSWQLKVPN